MFRKTLSLFGAALVAIFLASPAAAQRGGGHSGGGHSGGGRSGGGHSGSGHSGGWSHGGGSRGGGSFNHGGSWNRGGSWNHGSSWRGGWGWRGGYWPRYYYPGASFWWWWGGDPWWGYGWPYSYGYYGYGPYYRGYGDGYGYGARVYQSSRYGTVDTDVSPDEAEVWLNGKYIGTADDFDGHPDFLYLEPGSYHLEFRLAGHENYSVDVEATRGRRVQVKHKLAKQPGTPRLSDSKGRTGMPFGRVFGKNGDPVRAADMHPRRGWDARDDEDRYEVRGEDWPPARDRDERREHDGDMHERDRDMRDRDHEMRDRDDRDRDHEQSMRERDERDHRDRDGWDRPRRHARSDRPRLRMKISPDDAAVYVDDKYVGTAEDLSGGRGFRAGAGKHTVTVTRPGYRSKTIDVETKSDGPVDVVIDLEK